MNKHALIVAGGSGIRMGQDIPKQFLHLAGKPILMHTIEKFYEYDNEINIVVVLPGSQIIYWENLVDEFSFTIPHKTAIGGTERFYSVKNGLSYISAPSVVAIHDGVRPLVSIETINRCFEAAMIYGNSVPVVTPSDSLRIVTNKGSKPVNRELIKLIQTPQVFDTNKIQTAYNQKFNPAFTDDATVLEKTGEKIVLVEGNVQNIKITTPLDLLMAEELMKRST
jgi:2-C-methyl-D-erythritol 4-phosphate cytidylyltransferase